MLAALSTTKAAARSWRATEPASGGRLLFTGFIDNAPALRRELGVDALDPAELYAAGYAQWGDAVDLRVIGQFATILLLPNANGVRCTRSPLHAPPLHIWHDRKRMIVASLARVLFASGEVAAEIDEQKIADSLYLNYADAERGWYRGVTRVATGHRVVINPGGITSHCYYDPATLPSVRLKRDADYVDAANALLAEGTHAALAGFSKPAVSLSGGLDSQAVAAFAIAALGPDRPLLGLTGVPETGWEGEDPPGYFGDERHHVAALAEMYPTLATETIDAAGLSFDHRLNAMFLMGGNVPRNAMNLHWIHALRARAKAQDCDVLLSGSMGNISFSFNGAGALPGWLAGGNWLRLARELRAQSASRPFARALWSRALLPLLPDAIYRRWVGRRSGAVLRPFESWCPLRAEYAERMQVQERAIAMGHENAFRSPRSTRGIRARMIGNAMTEAGDIRQAMELIHGMPMRDPTAYRPLVEFCIGIPDDQYLRGGKSRWLARRMLRDRVPAMVLNEKRRGMQAADLPLRLGRDHEALVAELDALACDSELGDRMDLPRLKQALQGWSPGQGGDRFGVGTIELTLPRAIATARFIRFVEGAN
ncbi:hypothetical protein K9B35_04880 [Sphingomonas sp. R647]|nr:hypothetical protein [Sphingomonas sp. R647]